MPRYFFDADNGSCVRDEVGMTFIDDNSARVEAIHRAALFASNADNLEAPGAIVITVRDEADARVLTVRLVFQIERG
ncbi:DUF6894 family protein [Methylobacterium thuringiense]|uniref:DUF6894 domain-containing protein n=1 Tax=Methylobacterium thuringiense TaxID=1003091 RepID=A0ABQ4TR92_9HYPH|nr:hypothetical protein [Methylobacterium thuringiense]GJE57399.1 hypothetical protein EKPJFOCH_3913 [Methylobacterium thuringiense]